MTLNEYISALEDLRAAYGGDLLVQKSAENFERVDAPAPQLVHMAVLRGRAKKPRFWYKLGYEMDRGDPVVKV